MSNMLLNIGKRRPKMALKYLLIPELPGGFNSVIMTI